jgi:DNA-binding Lrp family transcriptional regulator
MNKMVQDLKMKIEAIKKTQMEATLDMENIGKRIGTTETSITNRIQEMEERISSVENTIEENFHNLRDGHKYTRS